MGTSIEMNRKWLGRYQKGPGAGKRGWVGAHEDMRPVKRPGQQPQEEAWGQAQVCWGRERLKGPAC